MLVTKKNIRPVCAPVAGHRDYCSIDYSMVDSRGSWPRRQKHGRDATDAITARQYENFPPLIATSAAP